MPFARSRPATRALLSSKSAYVSSTSSSLIAVREPCLRAVQIRLLARFIINPQVVGGPKAGTLQKVGKVGWFFAIALAGPGGGGAVLELVAIGNVAVAIASPHSSNGTLRA